MKQLAGQQFDYVYNADGTCTNWWCGRSGVVLAYDDFSPEVAHWFCKRHWKDYEQDDILTVVKDLRKKVLALPRRKLRKCQMRRIQRTLKRVRKQCGL